MEAGDRFVMGKEGAQMGGQEALQSETARVRVSTSPTPCPRVTSHPPTASSNGITTPQQVHVLPLPLA